MCRTVLTGGGDGCVGVWALTEQGALGARRDVIPLVLAEQLGRVPPPLIRALDDLPGSDALIVGTGACDLWAVEGGAPSLVAYGHPADAHDVAVNPAPRFHHIYATFCDSSEVVVWSAATHQVLLSASRVMLNCCAHARTGPL